MPLLFAEIVMFCRFSTQPRLPRDQNRFAQQSDLRKLHRCSIIADEPSEIGIQHVSASFKMVVSSD